MTNGAGVKSAPAPTFMSNILTSQFGATHYRKLDWLKDGFNKPWVSRKFWKDGVIVHELRCDICGRWYNYSTKDIPQIVQQGRWNRKLKRPFHCGNSLCQDYHERTQRHLWKMAENIARQAYPHAFMKEKRI